MPPPSLLFLQRHFISEVAKVRGIEFRVANWHPPPARRVLGESDQPARRSGRLKHGQKIL